MKKMITFITLLVVSGALIAEDITLPKPQKSGGMPLMSALNQRKTSRNFTRKELSNQQLSNLLWAAWGINRDSGKRTAPSAVNWQEIDIYVTLRSGSYRYDAVNHQLIEISKKDIKQFTGTQSFVDVAAVNLVYVADYEKMSSRMSKKAKKYYSWGDTGFISQNVYLYCASEGLGTVVIGMVERDQLRPYLSLRENQHIVLTQSVGYTEE